MSTISTATIDEFLELANSAATSIREAVGNLDEITRYSKTHSGRFSNQYELDVIADNIVQEIFADFNAYVLSEEREVDKALLDNSEVVVVVDPVDGSTNASRGLGYWSFSSALIHEGTVVAGVVVDQVALRTYSASRDHEATLTLGSGEVIPLANESHAQREVGNRADNFAGSVICYNSHEGSPIPFRHSRNFGSSALAICDVASGGFDAYIDDEDVLLKPWDVLASEYIALRSGAIVKRRDSQGIFAASGVLVTKSETLLEEFSSIFPNFFV